MKEFRRDNLCINDIEGSRPRKTKFLQKPSFYDVKDINAEGDKVFIRNTNPLDPSYEWISEIKGQKMRLGSIEGSKPNVRIWKDSEIDRYMLTNDIDGCKTGTLYPHLRFFEKPRNLMQINDIEGTNAGSKKKHTKCGGALRVSDPLNPFYVNPGDKELQLISKEVDPQ